MTIEIKAPTLPESVPDGTIATWYKKPGESVSRDELIVDIETDKVVLEVVAPADGVLKDIKKAEGDTIVSNEVLAIFEEGAVAATPAAQPATESAPENATESATENDDDQSDLAVLLSPAARKLVEENNLDANRIKSTGKDGRITKEDVVNYLKSPEQSPEQHRNRHRQHRVSLLQRLNRPPLPVMDHDPKSVCQSPDCGQK